MRLEQHRRLTGARPEDDAGRRSTHGVFDHRGRKPDEIPVADQAAGVAEQLTRLAIEDPDAGTPQDLQRCAVEGLELVVGEQAVAGRVG